MIENISFNMYDAIISENSDTETAESGNDSDSTMVPYRVDSHRTLAAETISANDNSFPSVLNTTNGELQNTSKSMIDRCISASNYLLPLARGLVWAFIIISIQRANS